MSKVGSAKLAAVAIAAVAGTVAFMIACGSGPSDADAASSCGQWQVAQVNLIDLCGALPRAGTPCDLPAGWQPVTSSNNVYDSVVITRCKP